MRQSLDNFTKVMEEYNTQPKVNDEQLDIKPIGERMEQLSKQMMEQAERTEKLLKQTQEQAERVPEQPKTDPEQIVNDDTIIEENNEEE